MRPVRRAPSVARACREVRATRGLSVCLMFAFKVREEAGGMGLVGARRPAGLRVQEARGEAEVTAAAAARAWEQADAREWPEAGVLLGLAEAVVPPLVVGLVVPTAAPARTRKRIRKTAGHVDMLVRTQLPFL